MTVTPSWMAWSIAATMAAPEHPPSHTSYPITLAWGATPRMVSVVENSCGVPWAAYVVTSTWLPAVVEPVCDPWPSSS